MQELQTRLLQPYIKQDMNITNDLQQFSWNKGTVSINNHSVEDLMETTVKSAETIVEVTPTKHLKNKASYKIKKDWIN